MTSNIKFNYSFSKTFNFNDKEITLIDYINIESIEPEFTFLFKCRTWT